MLRSRKNQLSVSLLAMTAFVLPASAHAAELNTSPLWADSGPSYHACNVANVSTSPVTLKVTMINGSGAAMATSGPANFTLNAGVTYELIQAAYTGYAYCRFNLPNEVGTAVRANIAVFHYTGAYYETLALSEAR
jgi:hypothetical protein